MLIKLRYAFYSFFLIFMTATITTYFVQQGLIPFYDILDKPLYTPEHQYFRYIWYVIYTLLFMGYYLALVVKKNLEQTLDLNALFMMQLFLQILWAFSFFYMQQIFVSAIVIILLDIVVALLLHSLFFISRRAFLCFFPYFLWLLFATYLNVFLIFLNP